LNEGAGPRLSLTAFSGDEIRNSLRREGIRGESCGLGDELSP
jgi:hypothetical protein